MWNTDVKKLCGIIANYQGDYPGAKSMALTDSCRIGETYGIYNGVDSTLFGEHLIDERPDALVCVVQRPGACVTCASLMPPITDKPSVWVATGDEVDGHTLGVLHDREVIVFSDNKTYTGKWSDLLLHGRYMLDKVVLNNDLESLGMYIGRMLMQPFEVKHWWIDAVAQQWWNHGKPISLHGASVPKGVGG